MSRKLVCSHRFGSYLTYNLPRIYKIMLLMFAAFTFLIFFANPFSFYYLPGDYRLWLFISMFLPLIFIAPILVFVFQIYRYYRYTSEAEIVPFYLKCKHLSLVLWFLDAIALGDRESLLTLYNINFDELRTGLEAVKKLDAEVRSGIDVLFDSLGIDPKSHQLGDMRRRYMKNAIIIGLIYLVLVTTIIVFSFTIMFSSDIYYFMMFQLLIIILSFSMVGVGLVQDRIYKNRIRSVININIVGESETSLLAEKIIERLLAVVATRISEPIILFLNKRYRYLKPIMLFTKMFVYELEPSGIAVPSIRKYIDNFRQKVTRPYS